MTTIKGKSTFEFVIQKSKETEGKNLYTPIFSTSNNSLWQLEYHPEDPDDPNCCLIFLTAIASYEEATSTQFWSDRGNVSATLFVKNPGYNKSYKITTHDYSVKSRSWGKNFNKITYSSFTIGVTFESISIETKGYNNNLCSKLGEDIIETWSRQLDVPESSDVIFNVKDGTVYANKSILSNRSEYFSNFFKGRWAEISNTERSSTNTHDGRVVIDVPDVSKMVFMEMLRYLYTDEVRFNVVPAIEIFRIADKYLLTALRQKARVEVFKRLTEKNAMDILFKDAWKWNDLKDDIMNFIVENFQTMKDTPEYKKLSNEHKGHPAGIEIFQEILDRLLNKTSN